MFRGWYVVLQKMGSEPAIADKIEATVNVLSPRKGTKTMLALVRGNQGETKRSSAKITRQ